MWINPTYAPNDPWAAAKAIVDRHPFAILVATDPLRIAHMPVLWRNGSGGSPVLVGHIPLIDPIARPLVSGEQITVVFPGPAGYVSPNWYHSVGLPTYNYAPVHVTGATRRLTERELRAHLFDLAADHEKGHANGGTAWTFDDPAIDRMEGLMRAIAGFQVAIDRLEVKTKLGQNRSAEDNSSVEAELSRGTGLAPDVAEMMRAVRAPRAAEPMAFGTDESETASA